MKTRSIGPTILVLFLCHVFESAYLWKPVFRLNRLAVAQSFQRVVILRAHALALLFLITMFLDTSHARAAGATYRVISTNLATVVGYIQLGKFLSAYLALDT